MVPLWPLSLSESLQCLLPTVKFQDIHLHSQPVTESCFPLLVKWCAYLQLWSLGIKVKCWPQEKTCSPSCSIFSMLGKFTYFFPKLRSPYVWNFSAKISYSPVMTSFKHLQCLSIYDSSSVHISFSYIFNYLPSLPRIIFMEKKFCACNKAWNLMLHKYF